MRIHHNLLRSQASEKELKIEKEQRVKDVAKLAADKSSAEQRAESLMAENTVLQDRSQVGWHNLFCCNFLEHIWNQD